MSKIGIIGVGSVGGAIASRIVASGTARELVLFDTDAARMKSAAADLSHAAAFGGDITVRAGGYRDMSDAEVIIIAAGANQKIGQSRPDLARQNAMVMRDVVSKIKNKNAVLIVVTNPVDSMVMLVRKLSKLPAGRVIGTGTMLDGARFRAELAAEFKVSPSAIGAEVLGEHGDSSVIVWSSADIGGAKLPALSSAKKKEIESRVRGAAMEIIRGRGATWDGIAAAANDLADCILNDRRRVMTVSTDYSMPRVVGRNGVVETLKPDILAKERATLTASARAIQKVWKTIAG